MDGSLTEREQGMKGSGGSPGFSSASVPQTGETTEPLPCPAPSASRSVSESNEIAVVGIGELVNLEDGAACARAIDAIRDLEWQLRAAKTELTRALVHQSQQAGSKTLRYEGVEAVVKGGTATDFDADAIYVDLLAAGMSEQRAGEVVVETVTRKVSAAEAKRVSAANPAYAEAISRHTRVVDIPYSVSVSVKKSPQ